MKAAFIEQTGPPEVIQFGDLPDPKPKEREVLVRIRAVSVNPIDTYIRAGMVAMTLPKQFIIGCDLAGEVAALGPNAGRFRVGDRVWASNQGLFGRQGTFAELACVAEEWLHPLPAEIPEESAAAAALVGITAHLGLFNRARLQRGETVFVHGGTGGVGSMVVQMARAAGARVITTAGSPEKAERCLRYGAEAVIEYRTEEVSARLKQLAPQGVDLWWETLREPDFATIVPSLARRGRIILMAGREARPVFPVGPFYVKDASLFGFAMFNFSPEEQRPAAEELTRWMAAGEVEPSIDRVLPISKAAEAHRLQEENTLHGKGTLAGKIVLRIFE